MAFPPVPKDNQGVPVSSAYKDSDQFYAIQASQRTKTDAINNTYAPPVFETVNQEYVREGLMYISTTGLLATATNPTLTMGASLYNPNASTKTIVVVSARLMQSAQQNNNHLNLVTGTDPALAQTGTPVCMLAGGGVGSAANFTYPAAGATISIATPGTVIDWSMANGSTPMEFIPNGFGIILPAGFGLAIYTVIGSAAGTYAITFKHAEY